MRTLALLAAVALIITLVLTPGCTGEPTGDEVVENVQETYGSIEGYRGEIQFNNSLRGNGGERHVGEIQFEKPGRYRFEVMRPETERDDVVVSNENVTRLYDASRGTVRNLIGREAFNRAPPVDLYTSVGEVQEYEAEYLGTEDISGNRCLVVQVMPGSDPPHPSQAMLTLWVDKETWLPVKIEKTWTASKWQILYQDVQFESETPNVSLELPPKREPENETSTRETPAKWPSEEELTTIAITGLSDSLQNGNWSRLYPDENPMNWSDATAAAKLKPRVERFRLSTGNLEEGDDAEINIVTTKVEACLNETSGRTFLLVNLTAHVNRSKDGEEETREFELKPLVVEPVVKEEDVKSRKFYRIGEVSRAEDYGYRCDTAIQALSSYEVSPKPGELLGHPESDGETRFLLVNYEVGYEALEKSDFCPPDRAEPGDLSIVVRGTVKSRYGGSHFLSLSAVGLDSEEREVSRSLDPGPVCGVVAVSAGTNRTADFEIHLKYDEDIERIELRGSVSEVPPP